MDDYDARETLKVIHIKRQDVCDAVNHHHGYQTGIVCLDSSDTEAVHQAAPLRIDRRGIRREREKLLEFVYRRLSLVGCEAETIRGSWASGNTPEFDEILGCNVDYLSLRVQSAYRRYGE